MTILRTAALAASLAFAATPIVAVAEEPENEPQYVCTAEQVLGPFLGSLLPITFSPEVATAFGVDPAECVTPVEDF